MKPRRLAVDAASPARDAMADAARVLRAGGVVAYPTDTVYGLAVDVQNEAAIARLYAVKQRPIEKALPVIIGALSQLDQVSLPPPPSADALMAAFWPGPLTLLLEPRAGLSARLRGQSDRIGVRWPLAPISQQLALALGRAVTATSANLSGAPVALSADEVVVQLGATVDLVLDGGAATDPEVSTILDVTVTPPRLLRPGRVARASVEAVLGCAVEPPS